MRTVLLFALIAALAACSSGQGASQPAPVQSYGPTSQNQPAPPAPPGYPPAQPGQPAYRPSQPSYAPQPSAPATYGAFTWHTRIGDAQAQARRENKLILVGSTKPGCSLCDKFKNQVVPSAGSRASGQVVGYMVQALTPEAPHIWNQLKANLPTARLMPLVGIFTPDLRYLAGFGGPADINQLMTALGTARRLYPARAPAPQQRPVVSEDRYTAQLNEYGEYEWTPVENLQPEDALTADITTGGDAVLPPADTPVPAAPVPVVAAAPPPVPAVPVPAVPVPAVPVPAMPVPAMPVPAVEIPAPPQPAVARIPAPPPPPQEQPDVAPAWLPPVPCPSPDLANRTDDAGNVAARRPYYTAPTQAPRPRPPFSREPEPALQTWGESALRQALDQIQSGELERAKSTLAEVHARLPGSTLAREASKGTVAIYNTRRLQTAEGAQREQIREQAERNLGHSMWAVLFQS